MNPWLDETLERFRATVQGAPDDVPLARAALLIAQAEAPGLDVDAYERRLDDIAETLRHQHARTGEPTPSVETLNRLLFWELQFRGDEHAYTDPRNLLLHEVLTRRIGIPITLAITQVTVAQAVGIDLRMVGLPGHVVTRLEGPDGPRFFDPFRGGAELGIADCQQLVRTIYGRRTPFRDHYLLPITPRQALQRLLHNLKAGALRDGDEERAGHAIELLLTLFPWDLDEVRDRGMWHERAGDYAAALADLETYVRYRGDARDVQTVTDAVRSLRRHTRASEA